MNISRTSSLVLKTHMYTHMYSHAIFMTGCAHISPFHIFFLNRFFSMNIAIATKDTSGSPKRQQQTTTTTATNTKKNDSPSREIRNAKQKKCTTFAQNDEKRKASFTSQRLVLALSHTSYDRVVHFTLSPIECCFDCVSILLASLLLHCYMNRCCVVFVRCEKCARDIANDQHSKHQQKYECKM